MWENILIYTKKLTTKQHKEQDVENSPFSIETLSTRIFPSRHLANIFLSASLAERSLILFHVKKNP